MRSFLVPAIGFSDARQAKAECAVQASLAGPGDQCYLTVHRGSKYYTPRVDEHHLDADSFLAGRIDLPSGLPRWFRLNNCGGERPADAYNVGLMVEGKRRFSRWMRKSNKHPGWWYRLVDGSFDCYAAWGRYDGTSFTPVVDKEGTRIFAARSGRGALFFRRARFDNDGQPDGFHCGLMLVEFGIADKDPARQERIKVHVVTARSAVTFNEENPWKEYPDEHWQKLADRAHQGFVDTCKPIDPELDQWRRYFIEQSGKWQMHMRSFNSRATFTDGIRALTWQQALDLVQEAWQLKVVLGVHCNQRFDESVHRSDTNCSRTWRMLGQYQCSDERRGDLRRMVNDYIQPDDKLWSYSGD
jgi:hypothetical protein